MFKKILMALAAVIAVFLIVVALQNPDFNISRSQIVNATPAQVFPVVNNFHKWEEWSPWAKLDPASKSTFEGPDSGVGAVFGWSGNMKVGTGKMTIMESRPAELIRIRLDFFKPMAGTDTSEFAFRAAGQGTEVTWSMMGKKNFVSKAMCLFMSMDKMMQPYFEKGLAQMKAEVEKGKKPALADTAGG